MMMAYTIPLRELDILHMHRRGRRAWTVVSVCVCECVSVCVCVCV